LGGYGSFGDGISRNNQVREMSAAYFPDVTDDGQSGIDGRQKGAAMK
jgi:hypothetical protein